MSVSYSVNGIISNNVGFFLIYKITFIFYLIRAAFISFIIFINAIFRVNNNNNNIVSIYFIIFDTVN